MHAYCHWICFESIVRTRFPKLMKHLIEHNWKKGEETII